MMDLDFEFKTGQKCHITVYENNKPLLIACNVKELSIEQLRDLSKMFMRLAYEKMSIVDVNNAFINIQSVNYNLIADIVEEHLKQKNEPSN